METSAAGQHMYTNAVVRTFASATVIVALVIFSAVYIRRPPWGERDHPKKVGKGPGKERNPAGSDMKCTFEN
jgi:hypothetical protein